MYGFCNVWVCVCMGFVMCGYVYVWVLQCVGVCMYGFCNVWVCVLMGFVMCEYVYVWVLQCVGMCMYGFCNVWVCVCMGFAMCGCLDNCVGVLVIRRGSAAARFLGLLVRIPPGSWMSVSCECCVFSGRDLCVGLITRPEEYYRVSCV
jgi:hypothetical protein